jgi:hypothetical protein
MRDTDDLWRRVEPNNGIARQHLTDDETQYSKDFDLPSTDWHYVNEPVALLQQGWRCGARAREETNQSSPYGPGNYSLVEVECARPTGHYGDHISSCRKVPLVHRWKIVSWSR